MPCTISGDRDLLFQAITNLLDNALKFAPQGGEVQVNLAVDGEGVTLAVKDNGPGVAEEHRARLTERFYRAPGSEAEAGAGLGLALADAILQAHGGTLQFSGSPGNFSAIMRLHR